MKISDIISFGFKFQVFLLLHLHLASCEQQVLSDEPRLRNATLADADDIATVLIAAFSPLSDWKYLYQFRDSFPKEHRRCARQGISRFMSKPSTHAEVIEAPPNSNISVVAVALWTRSTSADETFLQHHINNCIHKDLNITRALDWERKFTVAKQKHIDDAFGANQLYLAQLGTHPDYQLRGAGTKLLSAGIAVGRKEDVNVTLIAEPTAETFYLHLGFDSVANISIASVDNDQSFRFNVMAYNFTAESLQQTSGAGGIQ